MVKRRIVRKRQLRRAAVKKNTANKKTEHVTGTPDVSHMSRLEYEQSMMDPRFRAAMMGFNNPASGLAAQSTLREVETKNNELTRQITMQAEIDKQKKEKIRLKNELTTVREQSANEISQLKSQNELERMKHEKELLAQKTEREKELITESVYRL